MPKLCKDCKFFKPYPSSDSYTRYNLARCTYHHKIDLVSGKITYDFADHAREYTCKEEFYVKNEEPTSLWEQLTMFLM